MNVISPDLMSRCVQSYVDASRNLARRIPGGLVEEADGFTLIATRMPAPHYNPLFITSASVDPAAALARARAFYGQLGLPFRVTAFGEAARAADALVPELGEGAVYPGMVLPSLEGAVGEAPGLTVQKVETIEALEMFNTLSAQGFGESRATLRTFDAPAFLSDPADTRYIGFVGGAPVATSMRSVGRGVAMVLNVVTLPAFERRGIGAVMTRWAALPARDEGCDASFLHATQVGRPLYERVGYQYVMDIRVWRVAKRGDG